MKSNKDNTIFVVFISLLLDLLAFTMILPLLPALLDYYKEVESSEGLYFTIFNRIKSLQVYFDAPERVSTVLYGGVLGSMYSFLQFLGSPIIGALSDIYGRKPLMLICLVGITLSYLLWALSTSFAMFVLARFIGGISKGNISLSMAIITDVSSPKIRGKAMALVGIAFSIGFVIGPMIGALFAWSWSDRKKETWYIVPACFALLLAAGDLCFVYFSLKESLPPKSRASTLARGVTGALTYINPIDLFRFNGVRGLCSHDRQNLKTLGLVYFLYLFIYSGLEFTLTFLTHYAFGFTSMQQGWMFLGIGLTMAILQGGWVRRIPAHRTKFIGELGLWLIIPAFVLIGLAEDIFTLCAGILFFAISTAMVVTCMMTVVSRIGPENQKGIITGVFRSLGALARACGPIVASFAFWSIGSKSTYLIGAASLFIPPLILRTTGPL